MADWLFRRTSTNTAAWQPTAQGHVPGDQPVEPMPVVMPDRAPSAVRAAVSCFVLLLSPTPRDAGTLPIPAAMPDRAQTATRAAHHAYWIGPPVPHDAGMSPIAAIAPDRAQPPTRAANSAYPIAVPTPVDSGVASGTWPESDAFTGTDGTDLAAHTPNSGGTWVLDADLNGDAVLTGVGFVRQNSNANSVYTINVNPPSPNYYVQANVYGYSFILNEFGTGVAARWDNSGNGYVAYYSPKAQQWVLTYYTAGVVRGTALGLYSQTLSTATSYTLRLTCLGSAISLQVNGVTVISVIDSTYMSAGFAGVYFGTESGSISTDVTGFQLGSYSTGTLAQDPCFTQLWPSRADAIVPRTAAPAYQVTLPSPHDAGSLPTPTYLQDRASLAQPYSRNLYTLVVPSPPDAGTVPVPAAMRDQYRLIANRAAYQITQASPVDLGAAQGPNTASSYSIVRPIFPRAAYQITQASPVDQGILPASTQYLLDRTSLAQPYRAAAYTLIVSSKQDSGLPPPAPIQVCPDRANGLARTASIAYSITQASPCDEGVPVGVVFPAITAQAPGYQRAAQTAYSIVVQSMHDVGISVSLVGTNLPDRAAGSVRTSSAAYQVTAPSPADIGTPQSLVFPITPDRARGPLRTASTAYQITQASPRDEGVPVNIVQPVFPNEAWSFKPPGPRRYLAHNQWIWQGLHDPGRQPIIFASMPVRCPGSTRAVSAAYQISVLPPRDPGHTPMAVCLPDRASGPRRASWMPCAIPSPHDPGMHPIAPCLPEKSAGPRRSCDYSFALPAILYPYQLPQSRISLPDRAPGPRRAAAYPFSIPSPRDPGPPPGPTIIPNVASGSKSNAWASFIVRSPFDLGKHQVRGFITDRAPGPKRAAWMPFSTPSPHDAGLTPIPICMPNRAPGWRLTVYGSFTVSSPRDPGRTPVRGFITDRAPGWKRAAETAYQVVLAALKDPLPKPIPASMPDRAAGSPARVANYQICVQARRDFGKLTIPPIFIDPRAAMTVPEDATQGIDPRGSATPPESGEAELDPRSAIMTPTFYVGPIQAGKLPTQVWPNIARGPQRPAWYWSAQQSRNLDT